MFSQQMMFKQKDDLELIGKAVAAGGGTTLTISSIPTKYNNLWGVFSGRCDGGTFSRSSVIMRFNGDSSGSNYGDQQWQTSFGGTAADQHQFNGFCYNGEIPNASGNANYAGQILYDLANYKNTSYYKTACTFNGWGYGVADWYIIVYGDGWRSTSAINQIVLTTQSGTFKANTTFWLYGY